MNNISVTVYLIVFIITSCHSQSNEFVNHEKWMIESSFNKRKIKSRPLSVLETRYFNLNDTVFSDTLTGKFRGNWNYKFDKEGNIVAVNVFADSSLSSEIVSRIDQDGQHYEYVGYLKGDTARSYIKSKKIAANKYQRETYRRGEKRFTEIWTFENAGQMVTKERHFNDTPGFIVKEFYEDDLLKRSTKSEKHLSSEDFYYYSKNGYLDSQIMVIKNVPVMKFIYLNNGNGDPVYSEESLDGKIKKKRWMKYEYDDKGNWIKMIQKEELANDDTGFTAPEKYPGYQLILRQIKY